MKIKLRTCILPNLSKIVEHCMYDQLKDYFDKVLLKYQCWFKKWFSTQHCLLTMIEILRKSLDSGGATVSLLTDISKALDCLPYDLFIAKLHAYGINKGSLNLLVSNLKNRKQRVCLNNTYSEWIDIWFGVPQGSILGPLLINLLYAISFCSSMTFLWQTMRAATPHIVLV